VGPEVADLLHTSKKAWRECRHKGCSGCARASVFGLNLVPQGSREKLPQAPEPLQIAQKG